jgi:ABC-type Na+ transport system ATPase subunit NatA
LSPPRHGPASRHRCAALLGDPGVLLFDEPVNGLDTDRTRWARLLLRRLASEGRTVFVSGHLMSEMAVTADEVIGSAAWDRLRAAHLEQLSGDGIAAAIKTLPVICDFPEEEER